MAGINVSSFKQFFSFIFQNKDIKNYFKAWKVFSGLFYT